MLKRLSDAIAQGKSKTMSLRLIPTPRIDPALAGTEPNRPTDTADRLLPLLLADGPVFVETLPGRG